MKLSEIQDGISAIPRKYSTQAILAAMDNEDAITPWLLGVLECAVENAERGIVDDDEMSSFVALFLLSKFRNTQAFPLVLRISQLPSDYLDD